MLGACGYGRGDDRCGDGDDAQPFSCTQVALVLVGSRRGGGGGQAANFWGPTRKSASSSALRGRYDRASLDFLGGAQVRQLKGTIGLVCIVKLVGEGIERPVPIARVLLEGVSV